MNMFTHIKTAYDTGYLALSAILPNARVANRYGYFRYTGSLTTPPCTEGVIWTLYRTKIDISYSQVISR